MNEEWVHLTSRHLLGLLTGSVDLSGTRKKGGTSPLEVHHRLMEREIEKAMALQFFGVIRSLKTRKNLLVAQKLAEKFGLRAVFENPKPKGGEK